MKKGILVGFILLTIAIGIAMGIIFHFYNDRILEEATLQEVKNINDFLEKKTNIVETGMVNEKTTPNTKIVYETLYLKCNHIEIKEENITAKDVNQDKSYFIDNYDEWEVKSFTSNKIELYTEKDRICDKHYVVKEKDGYIAIYNLDEYGNENLKEVTEILTVYLPNEDIELLKKGIIANGDNELMKIISDYE